MIAKFRLILLAAILAAAGVFGWQASSASQSVSKDYYEVQTGHWIRGNFLTKYRSVPNSQELFGYPISPAFVDVKTGRTIQYFQKVRFEMQPDASAGQIVQISPLGEFMLPQRSGAVVQEDSTACRTFPATGFQVCYAFLEFFDRNGGVAQFGNPIANREQRSGAQFIQYFQNARLEYRPDLPAGKRIVVADLGREYFDFVRENPALLKAEKADESGSDVIDRTRQLIGRAFPTFPVTSRSGEQTIYVVVTDQRLEPVAGANVKLIVRMPSGEQQTYTLANTNANGITRLEFSFKGQSTGSVTVRVQIERDGLKTETSTSFRIWW